MEFAVLELGLKNKQIFNVSSFLRIQVEAFKVHWEKLCTTLDGTTDEDDCYRPLFDDWEQVFGKILIILNATLLGNPSKEEREFGHRLAKISLQTSNSLLEILSKEDANYFISPDVDREKIYFINSLTNQVNLIRNAVQAVIKPVKDSGSEKSSRCGKKKAKDSLFSRWSDMNTQQIVIDCYQEDGCLPLGQYYIVHKRKEKLPWSTINEIAFQAILGHLRANELDQVKIILTELGLDHNYVLKFILDHAFAEKLRVLLVSRLTPRDRIAFDKLTLIERVNEPFHLRLSLNCVQMMTPNQLGDLLTYGVFQSDPVIRAACLKLVEPSQIWSYLIKTNHCHRIEKWIEKYYRDSGEGDIDATNNGYMFSSEVSQEMVDDVVINGQDYLRESILSSLANLGIFSSAEVNDTKLIVRRLIRSRPCDSTTILIDSPSHPLNGRHSRLSFKQFQIRLIENCAENSLNQILYWLVVQNDSKAILNDCNIDPKLKKLLYITSIWNEDSLKDYSTLNAILEIARYLHDLKAPLNLQALLDNNLGKLAILASQFAPKGTLSCLNGSKDDIWYAECDSLMSAMKIHYPLVYQAMGTMKEFDLPFPPNHANELPSIYTLLKDTIILDISRLFCWQTTNHFRNLEDSSIFGELPHFSHPKLVGLYGLKANLTFIYYLKKGRPFEAYFRWMRNKNPINFSSKKVDYICKRATLLAFYNCTNSEISSACITFLELFKVNSTNLRLHLSVGSLIMSHAAKYLGLETKNQSIELGNLLKKAYYSEEKGAITHLMELFLTSFSRKYPENECTMDELVEYQLAIRFSNHYKLDLPLAYLNKCIDAGDWLMFTVYSQFYEYPKEIVLKQLASFSGCIPEHLEKAFSSSLVTNETKSAQSIVRRRVTESQSRDTLYSRLGLLKNSTNQRGVPPMLNHLSVTPDDDRASTFSEDTSNLETVSIASSSMMGDFSSEGGLEFDPESPPKDLFNLILVCQKYHPTEPGKPLLMSSLVLINPIPALIAASLYANNESNESCYTTFDCFCCWLYASFDLDNNKGARRSCSDPSSIIWSQQDFNTLIRGALENSNNFIVFRNGLQIFSPEGNNPLLDLVQFFIDFLVEKDYYESVKKLKTFQECLWNYTKSEEASGLLSSKTWMEETSIVIISSGLRATDSEVELHILLRHLVFASIQSSFDEKISVPDFRKMYRLSQCIQDTEIKLNTSELLDLEPGTEEYRDSMMKVIYKLQKNGHFSEAHQFGAINDIKDEKIHLNEWRKKILKDRNNFSLWKECFQALEKVEVDKSAMRSFIQEFIQNIDNELITAFILAKDFSYAASLQCDSTMISQIEFDLWRTVICLEMNPMNPDELIDWTGIWETILDICQSVIPQSNDTCSLIPPLAEQYKLKNEEARILKVILGKILNVGKIDVAYRLSSLFHHKSRDLEIINFCHLLTEGFFERQSPKAYLESRVAECGFPELNEIVNLLDDTTSSTPNKVIKVLEKCLSLSEYAVNACQRIILYYKISFVTGRPYSDLAKERDESNILLELIKRSGNSEALYLAKELIMFAKISDDQVSSLILDEILPIIREDANDADNPSKANNPDNYGATNFLALIRLINDPSILGRKFVEILKTDIPPLMAVELCIKAHECFTLCCDIEGISLVLRHARFLVIQHLSSCKNHQAMIRLLIGIGRYSEMSYIFDILKENHQFELLLRKGNQKSNQLRVALLDYLKGDKEMYPLIALNFSMHREIAEMLESGALKSLRNISLRRQPNCMAFKEELEKTLQEFMDASESYKKAGVFNRADFCDKMAQLVALQIHFLPSGIIVINMPENMVADFITRHTKFLEALIVADAYQNHRQWNVAIFNNVVTRGDWTYLRDYKIAFPLNPNNIEDIYSQFIKYRVNNKTLASDKLSTMKANLHKLIKQSSDLVQIYKYSQELGYVEAANNLMKDVDGTYLCDLRRQGNL